MVCSRGDDGWLLNGDLFDAWPSEAVASQQLAAGSLLPCVFSRAALLTGAVTALLFHLVLLTKVAVVLVRLLHRFGSASTKEQWWDTFAGRYSLLVATMAGSAVSFNGLRIASLTQSSSSGNGSSPLLALSFALRAGGSVGASVPLFMSSMA